MKTTLFFLICISLFGFAYQGPLTKVIIGKWSYEAGTYQYYDSSNKFLGDSDVEELKNLNIEVTRDTFKILYPNNKTSAGKYSILKERGKYFVSTSLSGNPFRYQIQSYTKTRINLVTRKPINFYVNGDVNQKASYCILKISLVRKVS